MSLIAVTDRLPAYQTALFEMGRMIKEGGDAAPAYSLSGMLYVSGRGFICLSVPNALVRGVFAAMDELGAELPVHEEGSFSAHITVFRPEELVALGGPERITERGKRFKYRLGGLVAFEPDGWPGISKAWVLRVHSGELQALRRSYGLSSLPKDGQHDFHITVAVRRRGVLGRNEKQKA